MEHVGKVGSPCRAYHRCPASNSVRHVSYGETCQTLLKAVLRCCGQQILDGDRSERLWREPVAHVEDFDPDKMLLSIEIHRDAVFDVEILCRLGVAESDV